MILPPPYQLGSILQVPLVRKCYSHEHRPCCCGPLHWLPTAERTLLPLPSTISATHRSAMTLSHLRLLFSLIKFPIYNEDLPCQKQPHHAGGRKWSMRSTLQYNRQTKCQCFSESSIGWIPNRVIENMFLERLLQGQGKEAYPIFLVSPLCH